jgi:hypothetical protein
VGTSGDCLSLLGNGILGSPGSSKGSQLSETILTGSSRAFRSRGPTNTSPVEMPIPSTRGSWGVAVSAFQELLESSRSVEV